MKIYLASSKRNTYWHGIKNQLEAAGHNVFDWQNHFTYGTGLPSPDGVTVERMRDWFDEPQIQQQLREDTRAIADCDAFVLLLPCGADAHTEYGMALGFGIPCYVLAPEDVLRASLFYARAPLYADVKDLLNALRR